MTRNAQWPSFLILSCITAGDSFAPSRRVTGVMPTTLQYWAHVFIIRDRLEYLVLSLTEQQTCNLLFEAGALSKSIGLKKKATVCFRQGLSFGR